MIINHNYNNNYNIVVLVIFFNKKSHSLPINGVTHFHL